LNARAGKAYKEKLELENRTLRTEVGNLKRSLKGITLTREEVRRTGTWKGLHQGGRIGGTTLSMIRSSMRIGRRLVQQ
jgi:hypothetical protein